MAIEMNIRIVGETVIEVLSEMGMLSARMHSGLGAALTPPDPTNSVEATEPPAVTEKPNGAEPAPAKATRAKKAAAPAAEPEKAKLDRAAIIDGLTKIYSKGDEETRLAIQKFRDGQGADRLRDLKDDALPAAAELLTELKLAESASAV